MWIQVQESIYEELKLLGGSFALGNLLMLVYGLILAARRMVRHPHRAIVWEDGGFWIVASGSIFWLLFVMNEGRLRFYALGSVAGGMWFHFRFITKKILAKMHISVYNIRKGSK
ncbi:Spore cortex protein YabQ (Spore_YabQ) [Lachnospiraceae bacterium XBB1006]|nr:Spore cortex protein YabQ (Spore_YabQ) [Lachnospiraceae bacterium XBB1006]